MHMSDALVSPAVGGTMWILSGGTIGLCARKVRQSTRDNLVPMMGILGAFVFAAQMVNFPIPLTGSSGHLGGGLLLSLLLGPHAAFLVIASVLTVQAFFFADGGLLALGCNIFNLGFFPAFVAYPVYKLISGGNPRPARHYAAAVIAAVAALQLGAMGVVMQTSLSSISELSTAAFTALMLPIHLPIGIVEGLATVAIMAFVARAHPAGIALARPAAPAPMPAGMLVWFAVAAMVTGGLLSWFASTRPDGLEWSLARVAGREEPSPGRTPAHRALAQIQSRTTILPDYNLRSTAGLANQETEGGRTAERTGTSISGIAGGLATLLLVLAVGACIRSCSRARPPRGTP